MGEIERPIQTQFFYPFQVFPLLRARQKAKILLEAIDQFHAEQVVLCAMAELGERLGGRGSAETGGF